MPFNSFEFLLFFSAVLASYYSVPGSFQRPLLLAVSYVFCMSWNPFFGVVLFGVTLASYLTGLLIDGYRGRSRAFLWAGIAGHLLILFLFKYCAFFAQIAARLLAGLGIEWRPPALEILLPLGLSFYVFQAMSYMIDVYRRQVPAERSLLSYMLFKSFFPQLVAGPIERAAHLLPQVKVRHEYDGRRLRGGLALIAGGLFKKAVIADNLSILVGTAFERPETTGGLGLFLGALMARYMIYCDIAGYTDIAVGCGKALGIDLSVNFARPFAARNIGEYWRRWHMTLSGWFRDYVFYSLAASPAARLGTPALVMTTFLLLGLWHGASWNFVLWGFVNGLIVLADQAVRSRSGRLPSPPDALKIAFTFIALVGLPTVFVVTKNPDQALLVFGRIFGASTAPGEWAGLSGLLSGRNGLYFFSSVAFIAGLEAIQKIQEQEPLLERIGRWPALGRASAYTGLALVGAAGAALVMLRNSSPEFIYFQF